MAGVSGTGASQGAGGGSGGASGSSATGIGGSGGGIGGAFAGGKGGVGGNVAGSSGASGMAGGAGVGAGAGGASACPPGYSVCDGASVRTCDAAGKPGPATPCTLGCASGTCVQVKQLALGGAHSCALLSDGSVRCWGENDAGQLGLGTTGAAVEKPSAVPGLVAVSLSAGAAHTCALRGDQRVACWGRSDVGQTGTVSASVATPMVVSVKGVSLVAAGARHTCARTATGVSCWGDGTQGQTGGGILGAPVAPTPVVGSGVPSAMTGGGERTCTVTAQGVACWGSEGFAAAAGPVDASPKLVPGFGTSTAVAAGQFHLCALGTGSVVACAGRNDEGQLGVGTSGPGTSTAAGGLVSGLAGVSAVACGALHTCALMGTGAVQCWGDASRGQLGEGTIGPGMSVSAPSLVSGIIATAVATGGLHTCAVTTKGAVMCWGANDSNQLGGGVGKDSATPVDVSF